MKRILFPAHLAAMALLAALLPASPVAAESEGIDVSHHNGPVDWGTIKGKGIEFVYVKASEGVDSPDPMFAQHWQQLAVQGIRRGAYHFFVTEDDPAAQAKLFLSQYQYAAGDLLPAIDIEVLGKGSGAGGPERLATFIGIIRDAIGAKPIIYTSARFWDAQMARDPQLLKVIADCPLWVAEYEVSAPVVPEGWARWTIWQWQSGEPLEGLAGGVDRNRLHSAITLSDIAVPSPAPAAK